MSLYDDIMELNVQGNNNKINVLKKHYMAGNVELFVFLDYLHNPEYNYHIRKMPSINGIGSGEITSKAIIMFCTVLHKRYKTGNDAKEFISFYCSHFNLEAQQIFKWIIDKSLKNNVGITMINKALGEEFIWDASKHYMRCSVYSDKFTKWEGAYSQRKMDGMYVEFGGMLLRSRSGSKIDLFDKLTNKKITLAIGDNILCGEMLIKDVTTNKVLSRHEGNGLLNSLIQGGELPDTHKVHFVFWDIKYDDESKSFDVNYATRFEHTKQSIEALKKIGISCELVETKIIKSKEEAFDHLREELALGNEGTVVKSCDSIWKAGTSKDVIKMKLEVDLDLLAVEFVDGNEHGKHVNTFGSLKCKTSDGKLEVNVSGFTDKERQYYFNNPNEIIGKVVTITCNDLIEGDKGKLGLFLPRMTRAGKDLIIRSDKTVADSLDRVVEIINSVNQNVKYIIQ